MVKINNVAMSPIITEAIELYKNENKCKCLVEVYSYVFHTFWEIYTFSIYCTENFSFSDECFHKQIKNLKIQF